MEPVDDPPEGKQGPTGSEPPAPPVAAAVAPYPMSQLPGSSASAAAPRAPGAPSLLLAVALAGCRCAAPEPSGAPPRKPAAAACVKAAPSWVFLRGGGRCREPEGEHGRLRVVSRSECGPEHCYADARLEWVTWEPRPLPPGAPHDARPAMAAVVVASVPLDLAPGSWIRHAQFLGAPGDPTRRVELILDGDDPSGADLRVTFRECLRVSSRGEAKSGPGPCRTSGDRALGPAPVVQLRSDMGRLLTLRALRSSPSHLEPAGAPARSHTHLADERRIYLSYRSDELKGLHVVPGARGRQLLAVEWRQGPPGTCSHAEHLELYDFWPDMNGTEAHVLHRVAVVPLGGYLGCVDGLARSCGCGTWRATWRVEERSRGEVVLVTAPAAVSSSELSAPPPAPTSTVL